MFKKFLAGIVVAAALAFPQTVSAQQQKCGETKAVYEYMLKSEYNIVFTGVHAEVANAKLTLWKKKNSKEFAVILNDTENNLSCLVFYGTTDVVTH